MAGSRATLHERDGEPIQLTRTVCPGALSPARGAAQSRATAKLAGTSTFAAVHRRSVLRCSGRANHRDPVTPPHLPGGKTDSGRPPGRRSQQRIDMGKRAWGTAEPTQPKELPP